MSPESESLAAVPAEDSSPLLEVRGLCKRFPGVVALSDVNVELYPGEVLAVIGENGAGKSTLMKILAGIQRADSGEIHLRGERVEIDSVKRATELGISLIHQELNLADNLDIGANIFLGREPLRRGLIHSRAVYEGSLGVLERVGLKCSPRMILGRLSIGQQQLVEIAKALSVDSRILIMDEPTSSLTQHETEQLYRVIRDCRSSGVSIVYISHRLGEVKELADRVVVLRDGAHVGELAREEVNHDRMVQLMVGREIDRSRRRESCTVGDIALEATGLVTTTYPRHENDFTVRAGEIVGMAGLVGAGRSEILEAVFGVTPALRGSVWVHGVKTTPGSALEGIRAGIALVPEDRKTQGLVLETAVRENLSLASLRRDQHRGFLNRAAERVVSGEMFKSLNIKAPSDRQITQYLSGGNQQKVVLGKWLALRPRILLLDEPTRGIDVGAKGEIYLLMEKLAAEGVAILFVSSEMEEVLLMSDRALVVHEGKITGELARDALDEETVMRLATSANT
jgi:ribose transport system ATP-binding protein